MIMTSRVLRTTRLACALAALGASLSVQAQTGYVQPGHIYCLAESDYPVYPAADDISARNPFSNGCIRDLQDGRAAVLLPSAIENIDRVPHDNSLRRHAWGFLDQNGRVAIEPIFEEVGDFRHGLPPCAGKASGATSTAMAAWPCARATTRHRTLSRSGWRR